MTADAPKTKPNAANQLWGGRFATGPSAVMERINASIDFDKRLAAQDIAVTFTDEAVAWIADRGFEPQFGARPLRRAIQREVDNPLARLLLDGRVGAGRHVVVDVRDGALDLTVEDAEEALAGQA